MQRGRWIVWILAAAGTVAGCAPGPYYPGGKPPKAKAVPAPVVVTRPAAVRRAPTPAAAPAPAPAPSATRRAPAEATAHAAPGFATYLEDGRLWVFERSSDAHRAFLESGEPAERVTRIGEGPEGKTLLAADGETLDGYLLATQWSHPDFLVDLEDGRLWVLPAGGEEARAYERGSKPAERVTRIGAGPHGKTLIGVDNESLDAYLTKVHYARSGYEVALVDGRLWVFRHGSDELRAFRSGNEPAERVARIGEGPDGLTLLAVDGETLDGYLAAR